VTDGYLGTKQHALALSFLALGGALLVCVPNAILGVQYQCVLHRFTGMYCPFCGMTRDFILMAHGSLPRNNPGSPVVAIGLYVVYPLWLIWAGLREGSRMLLHRDSVVKFLVIAMVLLFICNNLVS